MSHSQIAISGASLTALTFSLSLLHHNPTFNPKHIILFETRPPADQPGGQWYTRGAATSENPTRPLLLTPNSLKILDELGIYDQIKDKGFRMSRTIYRDLEGRYLGAAIFGAEREFGFDALRIEREVLFPVLLGALEAKGVGIEYNTPITSILSEDESGVTFTMHPHNTSTTSTVRASILIGADGIHSKTRTHVLSSPCDPIYHGKIMIPFKFDTNKVCCGTQFNPSELSLGLSTPQGAMMMVPASPTGTPSMSFRQFDYPEQTREGWETLDANKDKLIEMLTADIESWANGSEFVRSILSQVSPQDTLVWPVYSLPKLPRWISENGRVIIIGDAAHSLIPAAAQGANVGIEDSWTLARVLVRTIEVDEEVRRKALLEWQDVRMERIEKVQKLSLQLMNARLPMEEEEKLPREEVFDFESQAEDLAWLFGGVE